MSGEWLALGAVAAMAVAGASRRSAGTRGSRGMEPLHSVPGGFTVDPLSFVSDTVLEWMIEDRDPGEVGLFHVTTNLPAVLAHGRLRSRAELRRQGISHAGLGGGISDQAPNQVSVSLLRGNAERVVAATRVMAMAVHGEVDGRTALDALNEASEHTLSTLFGAVDWMLDVDHSDGQSLHDKSWGAATAFNKRLDQHIEGVAQARPGPDTYEALRRYETFLADTLADWISESWISEDDILCGATVGFTEPASRFSRVRPENVGLVQLAGRLGARVDLVPSECEARFSSDDLVIVGVWR